MAVKNFRGISTTFSSTSYPVSNTYIYAYPGIINNTFSLEMNSSVKILKNNSDSSYILVFGSKSSTSPISGVSYGYYLTSIPSNFIWSDYFTTPEPNLSDYSDGVFIWFPASKDGGILTFDSCEAHYEDASVYSISYLQSNFTYVNANSLTSMVNNCSFTYDDSSSGSSSFNDSNIVSAILMIPATLLVLAFFTCIYRIFINRRTRG